jgi:hypothetical protein
VIFFPFGATKIQLFVLNIPDFKVHFVRFFSLTPRLCRTTNLLSWSRFHRSCSGGGSTKMMCFLMLRKSSNFNILISVALALASIPAIRPRRFM